MNISALIRLFLTERKREKAVSKFKRKKCKKDFRIGVFVCFNKYRGINKFAHFLRGGEFIGLQF